MGIRIRIKYKELCAMPEQSVSLARRHAAQHGYKREREKNEDTG